MTPAGAVEAAPDVAVTAPDAGAVAAAAAAPDDSNALSSAMNASSSVLCDPPPPATATSTCAPLAPLALLLPLPAAEAPSGTLAMNGPSDVPGGT